MYSWPEKPHESAKENLTLPKDTSHPLLPFPLESSNIDRKEMGITVMLGLIH